MRGGDIVAAAAAAALAPPLERAPPPGHQPERRDVLVDMPFDERLHLVTDRLDLGGLRRDGLLFLRAGRRMGTEGQSQPQRQRHCASHHQTICVLHND